MNTLETVYNKMVEADIRQRQYEETLSILKEELEIFSKKFTKLHRNFGLKFRNEPFDIFYRDEKINILFKGYESISNPNYIYKSLNKSINFYIGFNKQAREMDINSICFCIERALK